MSEIAEIWQATVVKRWNIVDIPNRLSVAEHSFMVTMLTIRICEIIGSDERRTKECIMKALCHDLDEVITGDIPTPIKPLMDKVQVSNFVSKQADKRFSETFRKWMSASDMKEVKLADLLITLLELNKSDKITNTSEQIYEEIRDSTDNFINNMFDMEHRPALKRILHYSVKRDSLAVFNDVAF